MGHYKEGIYSNDTLALIMSRRSVRAYKPDPVPQGALAAVIAAGGAAPFVSQDSRHFSLVQERALIERLSGDAKTEGMKISDFHREMFSAPGFDGVYGAPAVAVVSGNEQTIQYEAVCGASVQNMLLAAKSLGLASCWVYFPIFAFHGPNAPFWRERLAIPDGFKPCAAVLLGYEGEAAQSSEFV